MRKGWEYKKLGDCFSYIKNGANIKQKKDADGFPITRIETLSGGVFNRDRMGYAGIHDLSKYADYVLESKDLLMSHINSKTYIGRTVEYKGNNEEAIIHGMNLLRLKAIHELIDSTFFAYYTQSGDFKSKIARIRKDAVNQSSFAISDLKRFDIPLPPKSTQLAIVSELDKINELIRLKKEQLKDFDNLAQSLFYEMFGDSVENEKGWEVKKLGDCFSYIKNGANIKQTKDVDGFPITRIETLAGGIFNRDRMGYAGIYDLSKYSAYVLESRDLLMSHINSKTYIGRTVEYKRNNDETIIHGMNLLRLKAIHDIIDSTFFVYYTKSGDFKSKIARIRKDAVNQSSFAISDLKRLNIPLPPLSLQRLFAQRIEQIEREKSEVQKSIQDLETLLASRIQYWFE
mgnify:FL=1